MTKCLWQVAALSALTGATVSAQPVGPNLMTVAQAQDRCMTTNAVRLTRETTDDNAIFEQAKAGCAELEAKLNDAIEREVPAGKQAELKAILSESERPNFMTMLAKIRSDRAARGSQ